MSTEKIPLVSVIIPMYNAERYISQTLESLLSQTMQDFEVVVIDDCSTDASPAIAESYLEKFGGRLKILMLEKNTGMPGLPRNVGINFARGKYIAFLDSDDLYTPTALEELSTLAENFQVDIVHTDTFFMQYSEENVIVCQRQTLPVVSEPTFETDDLAQRIHQWISRGYNWETYTNFCRRDFLIANQINFPNMQNNEDMVLSFRLLCIAENFLRVPNCIYLYRQREDSVSQKSFDDPAEHFHKWLCVMKDGFKNFEEIMSKVSFFEAYPDYRYAVKEFFFNEISQQFWGFYMHNPAFFLNRFVKEEFYSDNAAFAAYLFNTVNVQQLQIMQLQAELRKFQKQ